MKDISHGNAINTCLFEWDLLSERSYKRRNIQAMSPLTDELYHVLMFDRFLHLFTVQKCMSYVLLAELGDPSCSCFYLKIIRIPDLNYSYLMQWKRKKMKNNTFWFVMYNFLTCFAAVSEMTSGKIFLKSYYLFCDFIDCRTLASILFSCTCT